MPGQGNRIDFVTGAPEKYASLVDALSMAPGQYRAALGRVSDAVMRQEPSDPAGAWSPQRILAHMTFLVEVNEVFFRQIATMTEPVRKPPAPGHEESDLDPLSVEALLQRIEDATGRSVELLGHTPDAAWGRPGYLRGQRRSLRQMVASHVAHFEEHRVEILRLLGAPVPS